MKEIVMENFDFVKFFQPNYGLGNKPQMPKVDRKKIVWGVLIAVACIGFAAITNKFVIALGAVLGCCLCAWPIFSIIFAKQYIAKWETERSRRAYEWPKEFDERAKKIIAEQKLEERGMNYLGIDGENLIKDEKDGSSSFSIRGNNYDGGWRRTNDVYRTEYQEITWLYFGTDQLYLYKVKLSLIDPSSKREESQEFFYKDIVSVSVAQETVDLKSQGVGEDGEQPKQIDSEKFCLVVPGDKLSFAYTPTDYTVGRVNAMKAMIRDKKTH